MANQGRFGYTGQAFLGELGMYYYKARMYSPTMGRFMQTDPIGYGDGLNMYAYVGGDPVNKTDPSGLCDEGTQGSRPCSYSQSFGLDDDGDIFVNGKRYVPEITTGERIRITELSLTLGRVSAFNSYSQVPDGAGQGVGPKAAKAVQEICRSFVGSGGDVNQTLNDFIGSLGSSLLGQFAGDKLSGAAEAAGSRIGKALAPIGEVGAAARGAAAGARFGRVVPYVGMIAGAYAGYKYRKEIASAVEKAQDGICGSQKK